MRHGKPATPHFDDEERMRAHERLRSEILNYMVNHKDDPIELLKNFAERIRVIIDCDQVIYRDLEETRIMVNSPAIEKTWAVPLDYCHQCAHFDAHHPMYKDGYTEMENCQKGWQGIPVFKDCPIKSSLTRIVYCDGEAAGYLAIHYVQDYHQFTNIERETIEIFTRILSMSLSRYEAKKRVGELSSVKKTLSMMFALSHQFDPIIVIEPETGEYDWLMSVAEDVVNNTSMSMHGDDIYKNIGIDGASIIHEEDRPQFQSFYTRENLMKIAETGEVQEIENRWFIQTENRYRWKYNKAVRMVDDNGKVYVVIGVIDTTEEKKRTEEYNDQKKQLEIAYNNLKEANLRNELVLSFMNAIKWSFEIGPDDQILSVHYGDAAVVAYDVNQPRDPMAWVNLVHPDDRERVLSSFMKVICDRAGETKADLTFRMKGIDGKYNWIKVSGRVFLRDDGSRELFGITIDISEQMDKERENQKLLENARIAADAANQAKTNFLFSMSHDIRTPMNAIRGFTAMAKKNAGDVDKVVGYLEKIDISGQQLLTLINQVLEMARIESGKTEFDEKPVNVREEYNSMVTVLSEQANVKGLKFICSLGNVEHYHVLADEARMSSITLNIAGNAMKYTPEGGTVEYSLKEIEGRKPGYATFAFTVADTGIGMSEEYLKELYEPFTREKNSTVSKIQGTGLGMSIVKSIIDLMGGTIDVHSEPGRGTRFDITVDFKIDESNGSIGAKEEDVSKISFTGRRVLLVEDNEFNREIARDFLEEQGLIVEDAKDGAEAVAMIQTIVDQGEFHYYDFILMDVQMPGMNGYEAARAIRAIPGPGGVHIPIIAMTANAFEEDRQNALAAGMDEHLAKPIDMQKMIKVIAKFLK